MEPHPWNRDPMIGLQHYVLKVKFKTNSRKTIRAECFKGHQQLLDLCVQLEALGYEFSSLSVEE